MCGEGRTRTAAEPAAAGKETIRILFEGERTLFVQFDSYQDAQDQPFEAFARDFFALADSRPVERFVLDLRNNGGGNQAIGLPLMDGIKARPAINARGRLFILVGRATYSSAVNDAVRYRRETQAVFLGEPTGGRPNHYGEVRHLTLPNSGLAVAYSTRFFRLQPEDTPSFVPDVHVETSTADYLAGRDPTFEALLAYR